MPGKFVLECVGVTYMGHKVSTPSIINKQHSSHTLLDTTVYSENTAMVCATEEVTHHYYARNERLRELILGIFFIHHE
jgi:hypothetical protein